MHVHFHMQTDEWLNEKQNNDEDEEDMRESELEIEEADQLSGQRVAQKPNFTLQ